MPLGTHMPTGIAGTGTGPAGVGLIHIVSGVDIVLKSRDVYNWARGSNGLEAGKGEGI